MMRIRIAIVAVLLFSVPTAHAGSCPDEIRRWQSSLVSVCLHVAVLSGFVVVSTCRPQLPPGSSMQGNRGLANQDLPLIISLVPEESRESAPLHIPMESLSETLKKKAEASLTEGKTTGERIIKPNQSLNSQASASEVVVLPTQKAGTATGSGVSPGISTANGFFGVSTDKLREVVFVIDISASMHSALPFVKDQLKQAISDLPDGARFGIVTFSSGADVWKDHLEIANEDSRREAHAFVDALHTVGGTDMAAGLAEAGKLGSNYLFLLTDGTPNAEAPVLEHARKMRGVRINTTALGGDPAAKAFMESLAVSTGGVFVTVE